MSAGADALPAVPFGFVLPTAIRFGAGVRAEAGSIAAGIGPRTVLVVGRSFERSEVAGEAAADVIRALEAAGVTIRDRIVGHGEPDDPAVLDAAGRITAAEADSVVAVGGGSILDLAKAAAVLPTAERLEALLAGDRLETGGLPVIALPTTAGSGAEVSHSAIVTHRGPARKRGVRGPGVAARHALVDPELMTGAPQEVVAASGFDAIAHALETAASRAASPLVVSLAGIALPRLLAAVPTVIRDPDDVGAMTDAAYGAMLMGINLANSTTCLPHRLQYPVGARTGTGHAAGVAALMPAWLERTASVAPGTLARLARAAGLAREGTTDVDAARIVVERVLDHLDATGMRHGLATLGVVPGDLDDLVGAVEGSVANDPGPSARDDLRALYAASL